VIKDKITKAEGFLVWGTLHKDRTEAVIHAIKMEAPFLSFAAGALAQACVAPNSPEWQIVAEMQGYADRVKELEGCADRIKELEMKVESCLRFIERLPDHPSVGQKKIAELYTLISGMRRQNEEMKDQ
jgi:hypothetical protein